MECNEARRLLRQKHPDPDADEDFDVEGNLRTFQGNLSRRHALVDEVSLLETRVRYSLAALVAAVVLLAIVTLSVRSDLASYPGFRLTLETAVPALGCFLVAWSLLRPSFARLLRSWQLGSIVVVGVLAPWLGVLLALLSPYDPESLAGVGAELLPRALRCFLFGSAVALPLCLALTMLHRRDIGSPPALRAFVSMGAFASLTLALHCPIPHASHLGLGHGSVAVVSLVLGWVLGRLALHAPRSH